MIIANILGGLGNQMFQYAAARSLAELTGQTFRLDVSGFKNYGLHNGYELGRIFACDKKIATINDVYNVLGWQANSLIRRLLASNRYSWLRKKQFIQEPHFHYWSGLKQITHDAYLQGYWQSENYFKAIEDIIRSDFTFEQTISVENEKLLDTIVQCNSVSLHVRRGDYVTNTKNAFIGVCPISYYSEAIEFIKSRVESPVFFVFSDDMNWVKSNLKLDVKAVMINHNIGPESYNDMRLMSLCKHNIIANSSFSWWGAWLNNNKDKIVIAPKRWFNNQNDVSDLIPSEWITL